MNTHPGLEQGQHPEAPSSPPGVITILTANTLECVFQSTMRTHAVLYEYVQMY